MKIWMFGGFSAKSNFFQTLITPLSPDQFLNVKPLFNLELQGLSEYQIKNSKKSFQVPLIGI